MGIFSWGASKIVDATIGNFVVTIALFVAWLANWFLLLTGWLIDYVIRLTVDGSFFNDLKSIDIAWALIRDLVNIGLIFILLYIAFSVVLQLSTFATKQLVVKVVIVALIVNFSLFITKFVIDASNIMAREFFRRTVVTVSGKSGENNVNSVSLVFMNGLGVQTFYDGRGLADGASIPNTPGAEPSEDAKTPPDVFRVATLKFLSAAVAIIVAFAFLIAGVMFIKRAVILIFLMIFSPIAFLGIALADKGWHTKWWDRLLKESFMAPGFLFMIYLIAQIMNHPSFPKVVASGDKALSWDLALSGNQDSFTIFFAFLIVLAFLGLAIKFAESSGSAVAKYGIDLAGKAKNKAQGYAGKIARAPLNAAKAGVRQTIAKKASSLSDKYGNRMALKSPTFGGAAQRLLNRASQAGGVEDVAKVHTDRGAAFKEPEEKAEYIHNLASSMSFAKQEAAKKMYDKLSARERIALEKEAPTEEIRKTIEGLRKKLGVEDQEKIKDEEKKIAEREEAEEAKKKVEKINDGTATQAEIRQTLREMNVSAIKSLNKAALENEEVINNLSRRHIDTLAKAEQLSDEQIDNIYDILIDPARGGPAIPETVAHVTIGKGAEFWSPSGIATGGTGGTSRGGGTSTSGLVGPSGRPISSGTTP